MTERNFHLFKEESESVKVCINFLCRVTPYRSGETTYSVVCPKIVGEVLVVGGYQSAKDWKIFMVYH